MSMIPPAEVLRTFPPSGLAKTELLAPKTIAEACEQLARAELEGKSIVLLAGGTDWIVDRQLTPPDQAAPVDQVLDLTRVEELAQIGFREMDGQRRMVLGGGVTYWALRRDARVLGTIPMLGSMAKDVGAVQIQTRGTLAGNVATASPEADGVAALVALEGFVTLASARGTRRVALVESFFTGHRTTVMKKDELIASVDVRIPREGARVTWRKVGARLAQAISKVALAAVVETDSEGTVTEARFGMASVGPVTAPLPNVRKAVLGAKLALLDRDVVDPALAKDITPVDDARSTGEYRLHVAKALVWRALR
jgi:CO/xanthine dehydrogenase FAD-binding subunit